PDADAAGCAGQPMLLGGPPAGESDRLEFARQDLQSLAFEAHHPAGEDGFDGHDRSVHAGDPRGKVSWSGNLSDAAPTPRLNAANARRRSPCMAIRTLT